MNKTPNYQLSQWEASDRIQRTDFNADNAKIDVALGAHSQILAEHSAAIPKLAVGSYAGNAAASRFIDVGFTPKAVFVAEQNGYTYIIDSYAPYGGLAVTGSHSGYFAGPAVQIVPGGFQVFYRTENGLSHTNLSNHVYNYFALG